MTRRELLSLGALALAAVTLPGCGGVSDFFQPLVRIFSGSKRIGPGGGIIQDIATGIALLALPNAIVVATALALEIFSSQRPEIAALGLTNQNAIDLTLTAANLATDGLLRVRIPWTLTFVAGVTKAFIGLGEFTRDVPTEFDSSTNELIALLDKAVLETFLPDPNQEAKIAVWGLNPA